MGPTGIFIFFFFFWAVTMRTTNSSGAPVAKKATSFHTDPDGQVRREVDRHNCEALSFTICSERGRPGDEIERAPAFLPPASLKRWLRGTCPRACSLLSICFAPIARCPTAHAGRGQRRRRARLSAVRPSSAPAPCRRALLPGAHHDVNLSHRHRSRPVERGDEEKPLKVVLALLASERPRSDVGNGDE